VRLFIIEEGDLGLGFEQVFGYYATCVKLNSPRNPYKISQWGRGVNPLIMKPLPTGRGWGGVENFALSTYLMKPPLTSNNLFFTSTTLFILSIYTSVC
jgi:hypothetical protein